MNTINYSTICANLAQTMKQVCNDHAPVIITRKKGAPVVLISLEDYQALEETLYLLHSHANARRLLDSIAGLESDKGATQ